MKKPKILIKALEVFWDRWKNSYCGSSAEICQSPLEQAFIEGWKARQEYEKEKRQKYESAFNAAIPSCL